MVNVALIIGISGQDGSYLSELLLEKNYIVYGILRKTSGCNTENIKHILHKLNIITGDVLDLSQMEHVLRDIKIKHDLEKLEIYNFAALSHVGLSFQSPIYCSQVNAIGVLNVLEAIRLSNYSDKIKFYQASTSELFGKVSTIPQTENTPFYPRSPYGVAKLYGFWITKNYREAHHLFACNGILFNHESPRRHESFVTRKITKGLKAILTGQTDKLVLGNLDAKRDWGHARDYVYGMWLMLQQNDADDFVLCTNKCHTVREFVEKTFSLKGFKIKWKGEGINEIGYDENSGRELIFVSAEFFRPAEVDQLLGDCTKAKSILRWDVQYSFEDLIQEMVEADCS